MDARGLPTRAREKAHKKLRNQVIDPMGNAMYEQTENNLICRLDKKRRELDKEIAAFKARKDDEYRLFEKNLKAYYRNIGELPAEDEEPKLKAEFFVKPTETKAAVETPMSQQKEKREHTQEKKNETIGAPSQPVQGLHGAASTRHSASFRGGSPGPSESAKRKRQPHEHERELYGVFTPNYLPLLDSRPREEDRRSSTELLEAANLEKESSTSKRSTAAILSSSAEYHNQPMSSPPPPPARPLSASVPQDESLGHRRSSSSSVDPMGNRRSSLRNPKEPRSPKRVLFSIDDTVVSPSTSPIAQRSNSTTSNKTIRLQGGFQKNDSFEIVKGKQDKVSPVDKSATATASGIATSFSGPSSGWGSGISPLQWAYESENRSKTSPHVGGDDFEHVDRDDDLFAFDEDLDSVNSREMKDEDIRDLNSAEEEAVEDVESQKTLIGGSPHAGSLPIEIKWPGRSGNLRGGSP